MNRAEKFGLISGIVANVATVITFVMSLTGYSNLLSQGSSQSPSSSSMPAFLQVLKYFCLIYGWFITCWFIIRWYYLKHKDRVSTNFEYMGILAKGATRTIVSTGFFLSPLGFWIDGTIILILLVEGLIIRYLVLPLFMSIVYPDMNVDMKDFMIHSFFGEP